MKPALVIMAAGIGSRYGGLKQIAPVDDNKHIIIDYSIYDAYRAGFREVICVIDQALENEFIEHFKISSPQLKISYAYQKLENLPVGFSIPDKRKKPWGTAHAILSVKGLANGPFAVINADDFYGASAFKLMYDFLENKATDNHHAMVGYHIEQTLTESGYVSRGVCTTQDTLLKNIKEVLRIEQHKEGAAAFIDGTDNFAILPADTIVSMNMWGFGTGFLDEIENRFADFLTKNLVVNPLKCEYFLPEVVGALLSENKASVEVLPTHDKWYGVTYPEDMPTVRSAIVDMKQKKIYPENLWEARA